MRQEAFQKSMSQKLLARRNKKRAWLEFPLPATSKTCRASTRRTKLELFPTILNFFLFVDLMSLSFLFPRWHFYDYLAKIRLRSWDKSGSIRWAQLDSMPTALSIFFVLVKEIFLCTLLRDELTLDSNKYEAEANYAMLGQWLWLWQSWRSGCLQHHRSGSSNPNIGKRFFVNCII